MYPYYSSLPASGRIVLIEEPGGSNNDSPETFRDTEPVSLTDFQSHSRLPGQLIPSGDDPAQLERFMIAARQRLEEFECHIQCLTATFELRLDYFPSYPIVIPRPPLQEIISIKYLDDDGVEQTLSDSSVSPVVTSSVYNVDLKSPHSPEQAELYLAYGESWPSTRSERNAVKIRFVCGFGDYAASVPAALKQWILIVAATMYEHREKEITGTIVNEFQFVDHLLDPYRVVRSVR